LDFGGKNLNFWWEKKKEGKMSYGLGIQEYDCFEEKLEILQEACNYCGTNICRDSPQKNLGVVQVSGRLFCQDCVCAECFSTKGFDEEFILIKRLDGKSFCEKCFVKKD